MVRFFDFSHANKTKKPQAILTLESRVFLGKMGIFVKISKAC